MYILLNYHLCFNIWRDLNTASNAKKMQNEFGPIQLSPLHRPAVRQIVPGRENGRKIEREK